MSGSKQLKRRDVIVALGSTGTLLAIGCSSGSENGGAGASGASASTGSTAGSAASTSEAGSPFDGAATCVLAPQVTEGPYYIDGSMLRKDVREGRDGAQLTLRMRVVDFKNCQPIPDAVFDIWSCDPAGKYSGYEAGISAAQMSGGAPEGGPPEGGLADGGQTGGDAAAPEGGPTDGGNVHVTPSDATRYLRGTQVADKDGSVEFITLYPGWYDIRTHHVHFKVFLSKTELITGQIYFPQKLNDEISLTEPYAAHGGTRTTNTDDALIHSDDDPAGTWPTMTTEGSAQVATITIAVQR